MGITIAWANLSQMTNIALQQQYLPSNIFKTDDLMSNAKVSLRNQSHNLAYFLLAKLLEKSGQSKKLLTNIRKTESGRPYIHSYPHIDFNISHSADWVAVILNIGTSSKAHAVAIDIEAPQKRRNYQGLLNYYATIKEIQWFNETALLGIPQNEAFIESCFYLTWCAREAVLKSQGVGIVKLQSVELDPYKKLISSQYVAAGELTYTSELPFHLAYFSQDSTQNCSLYTFQNNELKLTALSQSQKFVVNP